MARATAFSKCGRTGPFGQADLGARHRLQRCCPRAVLGWRPASWLPWPCYNLSGRGTTR
jgi:hypothetical protein